MPTTVALIRRAWPLVVGLSLLALGLAYVSARLGRNPTRLAYPLDDTYIGMAMSKNLVESGTWGVNSGEFAPAASSPLWVLLQALAMKVLGERLWIPFVFALACAVILMLMVDRIGRREGWPGYFRVIILALLVVITPLVPLVVLGMEHVLHIILTIWALDLIWTLPKRGQPTPPRYVAALLAVVLLTTAVRFEGLFLAVAVACLLVGEGRPFLAMASVCASLIPVAIHGVVSTAHGWGWLPSSVMLKAAMPIPGHPLITILMALQRSVEQYTQSLHVPFAFTAPMAALAIAATRGPQRRMLLVVGVFALMFLLHMCFARIGWFYRYEAYLLAAQIFVIGLLIGQALPPQASLFRLLKQPRALTIIPLALALMLPQIRYGCEALTKTPLAMKNICDEQCQMAAFIRRFYSGSFVAVNDIGAVSYLTQAHIIDLVGLANRTLFRAKRAGYYNTRLIEQVCDEQQVEIAMVFDDWFSGDAALPSSWRRVGSLKIEQNVICGSDTVSFYAFTGSGAERFERNLRDFAASVPPDVHVATSHLASSIPDDLQPETDQAVNQPPEPKDRLPQLANRDGNPGKT